MKHFIHNEYNLKDEEINEEVTRVKALLVNSKDELLMGYAHNVYQFPGGHVENSEDILVALFREITEETGIELKMNKIDPFACNIRYFKDYPEKEKNRKNYIYYFEIRTDEKPNLSNTKYTSAEIEGNFELRYVSIDKIEQEIKRNVDECGNPLGIASEMLELLDYYKNYRLRGEINE